MTASQDSLLDPRIEGRYVIRTDPHCHILPGLDDGSPDISMSLKMAKRMVSLGIKNAIATPHGVHPGIETNVDPDFIREQVENLNHILSHEDVALKVFPGTEIYLRSCVIQEFEDGNLLTWADQGRFILIELGFQQHCDEILEVIDYFISKNITPIIAHPERYLWLPREPEMFLQLRQRGCIFQFNTMSINGFFGPRTQALVLRLMPHAGEFIIGTDSHHDADKYFDFALIKSKLDHIGLLDSDGLILPGNDQTEFDLSDLVSAR